MLIAKEESPEVVFRSRRTHLDMRRSLDLVSLEDCKQGNDTIPLIFISEVCAGN